METPPIRSGFNEPSPDNSTHLENIDVMMQQHRSSAPESHNQYPGYGSSQTVPQKRRSEGLNPLARQQKTKVTRACDTCKAKKSKCSGDQPCISCSRKGLDCQYESVYLRGRAPVPVRIEQPSEHQVQDESGQHAQNSPYPAHSSRPMDTSPMQIGLDVHVSSSASSNTLNQPEVYPEPVVPSGSQSREHEVIPEVPSRASPGVEVAGQYSDSTSGLSFLYRAWKRISNDESSQVINGHLGSIEDNQLLTCAGDKPFDVKGTLKLPSLAQCRELLSSYFDVCIATYRLLHRPTVEAWLETLSANGDAGRPLSHGLGRSRAAVVLSVLAVASFHEEKKHGSTIATPDIERDKPLRSDGLFSEAARLAESETGIPRLESAQSRLIQVLFLLMSCRFNQAWYTFGHTLQIISALGLHRRDDKKRLPVNRKYDYIDAQCRKRTFWVAYVLDKYLGVIFGRPRHYHDEDIDQDFPESVNDEDMTSAGPRTGVSDDCHIDSLVHHAKLAQIAESISREVYSIKPIPGQVRLAAAHRLGAELQQWRESLPPLLGSVNPSSLIPSFSRQAIALKISYCHAVMLVHRPFLLNPTTRDSANMRLAKEGTNECIKAAQSVLQAVDRMARDGRMFHAFWWTHYVCFCALVVVYVWAIQESKNDATLEERRAILDQSERCLQHLAQATATNSPSRKYSIILQELRTEAKRTSARQIQDFSEPAVAAISLPGEQAEAHSVVTQNASTNYPVDTAQMWQPLFGSPIDSAHSGMQGFLDNWQTTDWLELDSSAFGTFSGFEDAPMAWLNEDIA